MRNLKSMGASAPRQAPMSDAAPAPALSPVPSVDALGERGVQAESKEEEDAHGTQHGPGGVDRKAVHETPIEVREPHAGAAGSRPDIPEELRKHLQRYGHALAFCPAHVRDNRTAVLAAARGRPPVLTYASARVASDKQVVLAVVALNGLELRDAPPELRRDLDVVTAAVTQRGTALYYAMPEARANEAVVRAACYNDPWALKYAAPELRTDAAFVLDLMQRGGGSGLQFASEDLRDNEAVVCAALETSPFALSYASARLQMAFGQ